MQNIISEIILKESLLVIIFVLFPAILFRLIKAKKQYNYEILIDKIKKAVVAKEDVCEGGPHAFHSLIAALRDEAIDQAKKNKITREMFISGNNLINEYIHMARYCIISNIFSDNNKLSQNLDILFSDRKVTSQCLLFLMEEIKVNKDLSAEDKDNYIQQLKSLSSGSDLINTVDSDDLYDSVVLTRYSTKHILLYSLSVVPIIVMFYVVTKSLLKPDIIIAAVGYVNKDKFNDITTKIQDYLNEQTGKRVEIKYTTYEDVPKMILDIQAKKTHAIIINPGTYYYIIENSPDIFNEMELFAYHTQSRKRYYQSALIVNKNTFNNYLMVESDNTNKNSQGEHDKRIISNYIKDNGLMFTHKNSMSGFQLPEKYLWKEFKVNSKQSGQRVNRLDIEFTGDHDTSIQNIINGALSVAAVYNGLLDTNYAEYMKDITVLYASPKIPYNSYWYRSDIDGSVKALLKKAFKRMNKDKNVTSNKLHIDGWVMTDHNSYKKMIDPVLKIIGTKLPKPIINISSDKKSESFSPFLKAYLKEINAWDLDGLDHSSLTIRYDVKLNMERESIRNNKPVLHGFFYEDDKLIDSFDLDINEFKKGVSGNIYQALAKSVLGKMLPLVSPNVKLYDDAHVMFLNIGSENGLGFCKIGSCQLTLADSGEIIPKKYYEIEKTTTKLLADKGYLKRINGENVKVIYNIEGL
ncbi:MAG: PhnD/SsuA/transferrin family substrate-binding protein [Methylococcaceae bacterium]